MSTDAERRCLSHKWESTRAQTPLSQTWERGGGEGYAELHCVSNFTFLRGASHPEELVARAHELGYAALADHRRMLARGHRARPRGGEGMRAEADCRQRDPARRRPACRAAGDEPRWLRQPVRAHHAGAPQRHQGALHAYAGRSRRGRARLPRLAACRPASNACARAGDRRLFSRPRMAGGGTVPCARRRRAAGRCGRTGDRGRPAAGGGGRRAHACRRAPRDAGYAHRHSPRRAGLRRGRRASSQRRAPSARAGRSGAALSAAAAGGDAGDRGALRVFARRVALRVPRRTGSARRDRDCASAQADGTGPAAALPRRHAGQGAQAGRARAFAHRRDAVRTVFPHRARHRSLRQGARHPVPGARLGGQFGGVLRAWASPR